MHHNAAIVAVPALLLIHAPTARRAIRSRRFKKVGEEPRVVVAFAEKGSETHPQKFR